MGSGSEHLLQWLICCLEYLHPILQAPSFPIQLSDNVHHWSQQMMVQVLKLLLPISMGDSDTVLDSWLKPGSSFGYCRYLGNKSVH